MGEQTMNIKPLFQNDKDITLNEYLRRCNIDDPIGYINPSNEVIESYTQYDGMGDACMLLYDAITSDEYIVIVCDSDCDGYCSSAMAYQFLINQGVPEEAIIVLFHTSKQHGLSNDIMAQLNVLDAVDVGDIGLVWLPDAGTNDADQSAILALQNVPVLITDHHEKERENPHAVIVNNQTSDNVNNKDLCGTGVTHKVISAYCKRFNSTFHTKVLDLVALSTISDVCDVRSLENRMIIKWGLSHINNEFIRAMCDEFIADGDITPTSLAWNIIPKINAVCRGDDQDLKEELFYALANWHKIPRVIEQIKKAHTTQRNTVNELYEKALDIKPIGDRVKIFEFDNTPYTGLIATKLSDHYACPCMVVHKHGDIYSGSMRSPCELKDKLNDSGLMTLCMGHSQACGVGWKTQNTNKLSTYCEQLDLTPSEKSVIISTDNVLINPYVFRLAEDGKDLWGQGIPEPKIHISNITINGQDIKEIGSDKTTIKWLYGDVEMIKFFCTKEFKQRLNVGKNVNMTLEVIGTPSINSFRGKDTKQIVIDEIEIQG